MNFLRDDLRRALEDKKRADVAFLVGYHAEQIEKIQANSVILSLRSPVFDTQFSDTWIKNQASSSRASAPANNNCKQQPFEVEAQTQNELKGEKNTNFEAKGDSEVIEIPDANPAAFRSFLKYLYTDELDIKDIENTLGVYYLGLKYDVPHLVEGCLTFLKENLNVRNVLNVLDEATIDLYKNLDPVQHICGKYISRYSEELIKSEEFTCISHNALKEIVKLDNLGIEETQLFSRVYKWAEAECDRQYMERTNENIRSVLGTDVLYSIRFLSISDSKLTKELKSIIWGRNGILTNEEQLSLFRREKLGADEIVCFNTNPRHMSYRVAERMVAAEPLKEWAAGEMNNDRNHCCFSTNRHAKLVGFGFFGSLSETNAKYEINIEVKDDYLCTTYASVTANAICYEPSKVIKVFLETPLSIQSRELYTICYSVKGPPTFAGNGKAQSSVVIKDFLQNTSDMIVRFDNDYDDGCGNYNNSIYQLPLIYFST